MNRYERAIAAGAKRPKDLSQGWRFVGGMDLQDEKQVANEFAIAPERLNVVRGVLWSSEPDYSVSMRAVFLKDSTFWEVEASHYSCDGYSADDSWAPKSVSVAYIRKLIESKRDRNGWTCGSLECNDFINGLLWVVGDADE